MTTEHGMTTGAAAQWLRDHGFTVANVTVRTWCRPGGALAVGAYRTPGRGKRLGQFRVSLATLRKLLASNGIAEAA